MAIAAQIIRGYSVPVIDKNGLPRRGLDGELVFAVADPTPILFLDLKGDPALR